MELDLVKGSKKYDREALFDLRAGLVMAIDPLLSGGNVLQSLLLDCNRMAMGELPTPS
jgi:RNA polymerase sigma-70 factor, ECF subfamily